MVVCELSSSAQTNRRQSPARVLAGLETPGTPTPALPKEKTVSRNRRTTQAAFSLVELLVVVAIIGILSAIALPNFMAARRAAEEKAVASVLRTMVVNQQLFYLNPVPLPPSSMTDLTRRFARLHELNSYSQNVLGRTVSSSYVDAPGVRYSMLPLWPTTQSLSGRFTIQAAQQNVKSGFIYQVDESGRVVKIR